MSMYIKTLGQVLFIEQVLEQEQGLYCMLAAWTVLQASWRIRYQSKSTPAGHNNKSSR